jgi:hypothetical protein
MNADQKMAAQAAKNEGLSQLNKGDRRDRTSSPTSRVIGRRAGLRLPHPFACVLRKGGNSMIFRVAYQRH